MKLKIHLEIHAETNDPSAQITTDIYNVLNDQLSNMLKESWMTEDYCKVKDTKVRSIIKLN